MKLYERDSGLAGQLLTIQSHSARPAPRCLPALRPRRLHASLRRGLNVLCAPVGPQKLAAIDRTDESWCAAAVAVWKLTWQPGCAGLTVAIAAESIHSAPDSSCTRAALRFELSVLVSSIFKLAERTWPSGRATTRGGTRFNNIFAYTFVSGDLAERTGGAEKIQVPFASSLCFIQTLSGARLRGLSCCWFIPGQIT